LQHRNNNKGCANKAEANCCHTDDATCAECDLHSLGAIFLASSFCNANIGANCEPHSVVTHER
jgi:hypothetical protein